MINQRDSVTVSQFVKHEFVELMLRNDKTDGQRIQIPFQGHTRSVKNERDNEL